MPANVAKVEVAAAEVLVDHAAGAAVDAEMAGHVVEAADSDGLHATTATSPVTLLVTVRNLEPRLATIAARLAISPENATLLTAADLDRVAAAADADAIATAAARAGTFRASAPSRAEVIRETVASAMLAAVSVTFLATVLRARIVEVAKRMMKTTDSRPTFPGPHPSLIPTQNALLYLRGVDVLHHWGRRNKEQNHYEKNRFSTSLQLSNI